LKIGFRRHRRHRFIPAVVAATLVLAFLPEAFGAQRTFVSGSGVDSGSCSFPAPCRSFANALTHTDPGGEIIVVDAAGYGSVTISQSVSIIAPQGVYAGISVFAGFDGVVVNGAGVKVTLKGLSVNGQGGNNGINFVQGARLAIDGCTASAMSGHGIVATAANSVLTIADTVVRDNAQNGIQIAGTVQGTIVRSRSETNNSIGINVADGARIVLTDSVVVNNGFNNVWAQSNVAATTSLAADRLVARGTGGGVVATAIASGGKTFVHVTRSNLSEGAVGMQVNGVGASGTVTASLTDSLIAHNGNVGISMLAAPTLAWTFTASGNRIVDNAAAGISNFGSGTLRTRTDNTVTGNSPESSGALSPLLPI